MADIKPGRRPELTFEQMCMQMINDGHRRNLDYLEQVNQQSWSMALVLALGSVWTALMIVIATTVC